MKKFLICLIVLFLLGVAITAPVFAQSIELLFHVNELTYSINGTEYKMDANPILQENRVFLPIRFVVDPVGAFLSWEGHERKVTIKLGKLDMELWIDNPVAKLNGTEIPIDTNPKVVPFILNGRTMLPIRFIAENLGAQVDWVAEKKEIRVLWPYDKAAD